ncbi:uncharacterized protein LOC131884565 isoform X1 [Tigriopus californicus]|uniref:uncharacterized protein LOC131884565 isoform X1 n=1 Tax=Tigriopus californicus TaxID=6832 RepID=UPI0027DA9D10|nr:uncharacterized protein LOC131884565 isoform X1 [Tigriopus californicus]
MWIDGIDIKYDTDTHTSRRYCGYHHLYHHLLHRCVCSSWLHVVPPGLSGVFLDASESLLTTLEDYGTGRGQRKAPLSTRKMSWASLPMRRVRSKSSQNHITSTLGSISSRDHALREARHPCQTVPKSSTRAVTPIDWVHLNSDHVWTSRGKTPGSIFSNLIRTTNTDVRKYLRRNSRMCTIPWSGPQPCWILEDPGIRWPVIYGSCRHFSSQLPPQKADEVKAPPGQAASDPPTLSKRQLLKQAVKDYGSTVLVFHVGISLASLGGFYAGVASGIDMVSIVSHIPFIGSKIATSDIGTGATTFVVAYAVHKCFAPVRISITLTSTPFIVNYLRRKGVLK